MKKELSIICGNCGKTNKIPTRHFYDCFEGPFICKFCKDMLDLDVDCDY